MRPLKISFRGKSMNRNRGPEEKIILRIVKNLSMIRAHAFASQAKVERCLRSDADVSEKNAGSPTKPDSLVRLC